MLHIKKLPTYSNNENDVNIYILKDTQVYFTVLPYNTTVDNVLSEFVKLCPDESKIENKISKLTTTDIQKASHITNFQIAKDLTEKLNINVPLTNFIGSLEDLHYDPILYNSIKLQACDMIIKSINSVKYDVRPLNRLVNDSSAFNLLACDTMLDTNNKLHLIEINRGPDLNGLYLSIGDEKITNIFTEIFDIVIDNKQESFLYFDKYKITY